MRTAGTLGLLAALAFAALFSATGCTTAAAQRALNKPNPDSGEYSGFGVRKPSASDRTAKKTDPVGDDLAPDQAVSQLVEQLQRQEPAYFIQAENELRIWAAKQGVGEIVVQKVRELLKHPRIEVRAPALRLTVTYGRQDSLGDLIEVLADEEYGMRELAFRTLRFRAGRDFGYDPSASSVARKEALERWRGWWQDFQRTVAGRGAPEPRLDTPPPPRVIEPKRE